MNKSIDKTQDALQVERALKLALECLDGVWRGKYNGNAEEAIAAIREALMSVPDWAQSRSDEEHPAQCRHRIADARNPVVKSGYLCVDCGALFAAADHTKQPEQQEPWVHATTWRGLTDKDLAGCDDEEFKQARYWEQVLREKNT